MKRNIEPMHENGRDLYDGARRETCVENCKRRRALLQMGPLDIDSRLFFERVMMVRKAKEFIFISNAKAKTR